MIIREKLLFAVHLGSVGDRKAGILMDGHCLPIACSHSSWDGHGVPVATDGFYALWEAQSGSPEEFFAKVGLRGGIEDHSDDAPRPSGLWVLEVEYDEDEPRAFDDDDDIEEWEWLCGGELRRPTAEELEPLTRGAAPWGGMVL